MPDLYHCTQPACYAQAVVHGSSTGLRAIGWFTGNSSVSIKCPIHHPEHDEMIASTAVIQYVLEHHYDTFLSLDTQRRLADPGPDPTALPITIPQYPPVVRPMSAVPPMNIFPGETWVDAAKRYLKENGG